MKPKVHRAVALFVGPKLSLHTVTKATIITRGFHNIFMTAEPTEVWDNRMENWGSE